MGHFSTGNVNRLDWRLTRLCGFDVAHGVPWGRPGNLSACAGPCGERDKGSLGGSEHCSLRFSAHNRPYLMTMAAATYKQCIVLGRFSTALLLPRPKESKETIILTKRPKRAKKRKIKEIKIAPRFFRENGLSSGKYPQWNWGAEVRAGKNTRGCFFQIAKRTKQTSGFLRRGKTNRQEPSEEGGSLTHWPQVSGPNRTRASGSAAAEESGHARIFPNAPISTPK